MCHTIFNKVCFVIKRLWTHDWRVYTIIYTTILFVPIIVSQSTCCFSIIFTVSSKLYIGIVTSKSSALPIFTPLILEVQLINGALFLKTNFFSPNALSFAVLVAFTLASVLLGASKSSAVNIFSNSNISFYNNICIRIIT